MFLERFLLGNLWSCGLILLMLALKRILRNRLSLRAQYHRWYVLLISLTLSFLPWNLLGNWDSTTTSDSRAFAISSTPGHVSGDPIEGAALIQDATELVQVVDNHQAVVLTIWIVGVLVFTGVYLCGCLRLRKLRQCAARPTDEMQSLFDACCKMLRLRQNIQLRQSERIDSPISFGFRTPMVLLPQREMEVLSKAELEHIFLHELTHIRHLDLVTNYLYCGAQALYWFNPLVWVAFRQMRRDREAYCDWAILNELPGEEERLCYGQTILRFAARSSPRFHVANSLFPSKEQLKYRLEQIVDFQQETKWKRAGGRCLGCLLVVISVCQIPALAFCSDDAGEYYYPTSTLSITEGNWADLFADVNGCVVVYDLRADRYTVYNEEEITHRVSPCSTYKIYSSLNALELGIITPENSTLSWDSAQREFAAWNRDHDLASAMDNSVNWYFQTLDQEAGIDQLRGFYHRIQYGNCEIGDDIQNYWNGSALKISALEQVELLVKLYRNDFGFAEANIAAVKNALAQNKSGLYGKTGTGRLDGINVAGWFVGFEEVDGNVYFFAVYLYSYDGADGAVATQTALEILERIK